MPDPIERLREHDPAAFLSAADAPADVLARIVATPPAARPRRAPKLVVAVAAAALALVATVLVLAPSGHGVSLAQRAYAATAPADAVTYTQTSSTDKHNGVTVSTSHARTWQHGDRFHDLLRTVQGGKTWDYEHDQKGGVFRTLVNGKVQSIRRDDPGWRGDVGKDGFAQNLQTVVQRFRARFSRLRDAGETTFNGRPARAYTDGSTTYYVDRETALPLGSVFATSWYEPVHYDEATHKLVRTGRTVEMRMTTTIERYEKLPPTPENLALLDAPRIDAAER